MSMNELSIRREDLVVANQDRIGEALAVREAKQVESMVILAKRFPRDLLGVERQIINQCRRVRLAEMAEYVFPRGGKDVSGPSIRLAEVLMQCYGNMVAGWKEVQRNSDNSDCEAYAWDIENNVKISKDFNVPHYRDTRNGRMKLNDDRDIKEMCANQAARTLRGCILQIIPGDLVDLAIESCKRTLAVDKTPLPEQIERATMLFEQDYQITKPQLEKVLGLPMKDWTKANVHQLRKMLNTLKNGESTVADMLKNAEAKISGNQIKELAKIIGNNEDRKAFLKNQGYPELRDIPLSEFEIVKNDLLSIKDEQ